MIRFVLLSLALAAPATADIDRVLDGHILPRIEALSETSATLAEVAATCDMAQTRTAWIDAFTAWSGVQHLSLGPGQEDGRWPAIAFWPDDRDATRRALARLIDAGDLSAPAIARASVAGRGLMALERLLWETGAPCSVRTAIAADLAATTAEVRAEWDSFAGLVRNAGTDGNTRFLAPEEAEAALFTALMTGMQHTADQRLGRPLGTFDRPRPGRAEARRSGQSQAAIVAALNALRELADLLADAPRTIAELGAALDLATALDDPDLSGVSDPARRIRVEAVHTRVQAAIGIAAEEIGAELGVSVGFNALDGD